MVEFLFALRSRFQRNFLLIIRLLMLLGLLLLLLLFHLHGKRSNAFVFQLIFHLFHLLFRSWRPRNRSSSLHQIIYWWCVGIQSSISEINGKWKTRWRLQFSSVLCQAEDEDDAFNWNVNIARIYGKENIGACTGTKSHWMIKKIFSFCNKIFCERFEKFTLYCRMEELKWFITE